GGRAWLQPLQLHNFAGGAADCRQVPSRSAHQSADGRSSRLAGRACTGADLGPVAARSGDGLLVSIPSGERPRRCRMVERCRARQGDWPCLNSGCSPLVSSATQAIAASQTPRALILRDRCIAVAEVLDAWLALDYRYFKLRGADGDTYLVRDDERSNTWELTMFRAEQVDGS